MDSYAKILILLTGLILGLCAGFIMHRSDYCIAGMFRDVFIFNSWFRLRTLMLLVVSSMLLFEAARLAGVIPLYPFPLIGFPSLANLIGGFFFGVGMVLAGGCVVGTLYKLGSGSVPAMVAFAGLIAGSAVYGEVHPWWSSVIGKTILFNGKATVPQLLGMDPWLPVLLVSLAALCYFYRVYRLGGWTRPSYAEGSLQPWKAAIMLAAIGTVSVVVIGMPLGITTAYAKIAGCLESIFFTGHFQGLSYFKQTVVNYRHQLTGIQLVGGTGLELDAIALIQFPVITGIIIGSAFSAVQLKEFKIVANLPLKQYIAAAVGGLIMGLASRMAPACNIWHLLGGLPIMAIQSILFLAGIIPGACLGALFMSRLVIR